MAKSSSKKAPGNAPSKTTSTAPKAFDPQPDTGADNSLRQLFVSAVKEIYWAENHLVKSLPKMVKAAASAELKEAIAQHRELTKDHAARLEQVLDLLGEKIVAQKCDAMEGLTMSGEHVIENTIAGTETRDMGIIMSSLKVENFEITTYKGLIQLAGTLGQTEAAALLQQTLEEEMTASDMLETMTESSNAPDSAND